MTKLKNLLRCYASGMGIRSISSTFHISRNTLRKYVRKFQESGLSMEQILSLSDDKLADLFSDGHSRNRPPSARKLELEALVPDYVKRLSKKGVSILSLHTEYLKTHPNGYQYSTFKHAIHAYRCQTQAVGHVEHLAGDQMYIDYAGDKLEIVEEQTGEVRKVEVFCGYPSMQSLHLLRGSVVPEEGRPYRCLRECSSFLWWYTQGCCA